ncbi:hypothetical protein E4O04_09655 [Treponema sp. OMZ 799]|uniref:hypothetical protein n=1 Tax=Treponema sp. OMZ 799 TaxID=2563668 RepID=UPI0020A2D590|nr:hypothetical protein [Treponema sp. OMZ 799]UTC77069.1 hypothetical protein E4O04_03225 [Treponema sp. OMZ 799]UTC78254.1 hypothetical protein E4O04_09655 [Treponema sp. OMZ 799]
MGGFTSYTWVDNALLDGMDYFSGVFFYFLNIANKLAVIVALVGIVINCIKLWFGAIAVRKMAISTILNFMLFLGAIGLYNIAVGTIAKTATIWGSEAGGGKAVVQQNLVALMEQCEHDLKVAKTIENMSPEQAQSYIAQRKLNITQKGLGSGRSEKKNSPFADGVVDKNGPEEYMNSVNLYRTTEQNIAAAQANIDALKAVLSPTKIKDKNGNLIDTYFLDVMIHDTKGGGSNFISPASFFKVSILLAKLLMQREFNYLTVKIGKAQDEADQSWNPIKPPRAIVVLSAMSFSDYGNIILTFICGIAIVFAAIFVLMQYCMAIFEYAIVTSICIAFIPFILANETKAIAKKILPSFWGQAIKLLILTICMWFAMYQYIYLAAGQMGEDSAVDLGVFAYIMFTIILSFVVTQNGPQIARTILTGEPQLSMGELVAAGATVAGGAAAIASAPGRIKQGVQKTASAVGGAIGKGANMIGTGAGMIKEARSAGAAARMEASEKGYSLQEQGTYGRKAMGAAIGGHMKNAGKNFLHNLSHASATKDNRNGGSYRGSTFNNRFDGHEGKVPHTSFVQAKNADGTSQTLNEYISSMGKAGESIGRGIVPDNKNVDPSPGFERPGLPPPKPGLPTPKPELPTPKE